MNTLTQLSQSSSSAAAFAKLPKWLKTALNSCPRAGEGVHFWIFRIARNLIVHMNEAEIFTLLKNKVANCGRPVSDREVLSQIRSARIYAWRPEKPDLFPLGASLPDEVALRSPPPAWPEAKLETIRSIVEGGGKLYDLAESSPIRFDYALSTGSRIIDLGAHRASLAMWKYCQDSARYLFDDTLTQPKAKRLLAALRNTPEGMTRTDISVMVFKKNLSSRAITEMLDSLKALGVLESQPPKSTAGRPSERWVLRK
jgi:hypothetical protein